MPAIAFRARYLLASAELSSGAQPGAAHTTVRGTPATARGRKIRRTDQAKMKTTTTAVAVIVALAVLKGEARAQELDVPTMAFASSAAIDWVTT